MASTKANCSPHILKNQLVIFFGLRALSGASPFRAVIMSSFFIYVFVVCGFGYIKPNILLKSTFTSNGKKCFTKMVAFFLLLWCRVSSPGLLIRGNCNKAFGFPSVIYTHFVILHIPLGLFVSFSTVCLYSLLVFCWIACFFLLCAAL